MEVKVICDSVAPNGKRLTTLSCSYWRAIHAEVMTHRMFARNAASSRAIPFFKYLKSDGPSMNIVDPKCTYAMLRDSGFIPKYIGAEQKGMQSGEQLSEQALNEARSIIHDMMYHNLDKCKRLHALGVHKSIINRYLEPWSMITTLITATEWNNFFKLRIHPAAEKHFNELATEMKRVMDASVPVKVEYGGWHLPYLNFNEEADLLKVAEQYACEPMTIRKRVSAARCARVSYLTQEGKRDITADLALAERLMNPGDGAFHASPFEHVASPAKFDFHQSGCFYGWKQYRKEFPNENAE